MTKSILGGRKWNSSVHAGMNHPRVRGGKKTVSNHPLGGSYRRSIELEIHRSDRVPYQLVSSISPMAFYFLLISKCLGYVYKPDRLFSWKKKTGFFFSLSVDEFSSPFRKCRSFDRRVYFCFCRNTSWSGFWRREKYILSLPPWRQFVIWSERLRAL